MNRNKRRQLKKLAAKRGPVAQTLSGEDQEFIAAALNQANAALASGNRDLVSQLCDRVLQLAPNHPDALNLQAALYVATGDLRNAIKLFTKITSLVPEFAQAHFNLGTALNSHQKQKQAIRPLQRAIQLDPNYADAYYNLGNALRQLDRKEEAIDLYSQTLQLDPAHSAAATNLASAHLQQGNAEQALAASALALQSDPGNRDALSFYAIAATETGDRQKAAELLNPDALVRPKQFTTRAGYESLASFNASLVTHVLNHPTLAQEPHNKATRNGQQTENLALGDRGPVAELQIMIGEALDEFLAAVGKQKDHPYPPLIPHLTKIDIWGTVLGSQGHQAAHMHRAAWVSGVYYAKLPDIMHAGDHGNEGWIEFCRPPDEFKCLQSHDVKMIEPQEGLMVLFPSYIYHRTIPFESNDKRISIAFDLLA